MILSDGKNDFKNNTYSFWEWSAPILQTFDEVMAKIRELKLQGRVIRGFYAVGMGYNWREDDVGEAIYIALERKIENKQIFSDRPFPFLPEEVYIPAYAEIDEPFLIEFEGGDILAVDYSEGSSVRMELNTIPKNIKCAINEKNFHPGVLFESFIGKRIAAVEVTASTVCDEFTGSYGLSIDEQDSYITKISIVCRNDGEWEQEKLEFTSFYNFGVVTAADYSGETLTVHAPDVRRITEGFIDEEILNEQNEYHFNV